MNLIFRYFKIFSLETIILILMFLIYIIYAYINRNRIIAEQIHQVIPISENEKKLYSLVANQKELFEVYPNEYSPYYSYYATKLVNIFLLNQINQTKFQPSDEVEKYYQLAHEKSSQNIYNLLYTLDLQDSVDKKYLDVFYDLNFDKKRNIFSASTVSESLQEGFDENFTLDFLRMLNSKSITLPDNISKPLKEKISSNFSDVLNNDKEERLFRLANLVKIGIYLDLKPDSYEIQISDFIRTWDLSKRDSNDLYGFLFLANRYGVGIPQILIDRKSKLIQNNSSNLQLDDLKNNYELFSNWYLIDDRPIPKKIINDYSTYLDYFEFFNQGFVGSISTVSSTPKSDFIRCSLLNLSGTLSITDSQNCFLEIYTKNSDFTRLSLGDLVYVVQSLKNSHDVNLTDEDVKVIQSKLFSDLMLNINNFSQFKQSLYLSLVLHLSLKSPDNLKEVYDDTLNKTGDFYKFNFENQLYSVVIEYDLLNFQINDIKNRVNEIIQTKSDKNFFDTYNNCKLAYEAKVGAKKYCQDNLTKLKREYGYALSENDKLANFQSTYFMYKIQGMLDDVPINFNE